MVKSCEYALIFLLLSNACHNVVLIAHRQTEKRTDWLIHFYLNMVISFSYKTCLPESSIETEVIKWRYDHLSGNWNLGNCKLTWKTSFGISNMATVLALQCSTDWAMKTHTLGALHSVSFLSRVKMNSTNWPAPNVCNVWVFIAHLVEHCSANAEALGSNPVKVPNFFFFFGGGG